MDDGMAKDLEEFERAYAASFEAGLCKDRAIGRPRLLASPGARVGVILVHGYMAAPEEVALLGQRLRDCGYAVYLPRLPGHGTSPRDLAAVGWRDWARAVDESYGAVSSLCPTWVIAGFSTGAGLALLEAEVHGERYAAVVSLSAPLSLASPAAPLMRPYDRLIRLAQALGIAGPEAGFFPNHPDNPEINYGRNCVHGVAEVQRLMARVRAGLGSVRLPALVMQGLGDTTVSASAPGRIHRRLGSSRKRLVLVPSDRHGIVRGPSAEDTFLAVRDFLLEILPPRP